MNNLVCQRCTLGVVTIVCLFGALFASADSEINGIWLGNALLSSSPSELPYTLEGKVVHDAQSYDEGAILSCTYDYGRVLAIPFPLEIIRSEGQVTVLYEIGAAVRRIYVEPRQPPDTQATWLGSSAGKWEEGTLVVKITKLRPGYFFNGKVLEHDGNLVVIEGYTPYSDETVITERYSVNAAGDQLTIMRTIEDPKYYSRAWDMTTVYEPADVIYPYECEFRPYEE